MLHAYRYGCQRLLTLGSASANNDIFWCGAGLGPNARRKDRWVDRWFLNRSKPKNNMATTIPMKIEPKTFFANERTFLSWLHMAVTIGSIGAALLGFSGAASEDPKAHTVRPPCSHIHDCHCGFPRGPHHAQAGSCTLSSSFLIP